MSPTLSVDLRTAAVILVECTNVSLLGFLLGSSGFCHFQLFYFKALFLGISHPTIMFGNFIKSRMIELNRILGRKLHNNFTNGAVVCSTFCPNRRQVIFRSRNFEASKATLSEAELLKCIRKTEVDRTHSS